MLAHVTHILPVTNIQRERVLPRPGQVTVRKGQKVTPGDVIAEAVLIPEHDLLDIARGLGVSAQKADQYIQRKVGEEVGEGDVIAGPVGMARRVVRAPRPGKVVVVGSGQVLIQAESKPYELRAGMDGVVTDLIPDLGAIITTSGALIQGVWGNGRMDFGLLNVQMRSADDTLTTDQLDVSLRGAVVLGGFCGDKNVLISADELPLRGLILASMDSTLIPVAMKMRYPILLTEGFGRTPMSSAAFKLLSTSARREVSVNAEPWNRYEGTRPEIIIPLPTTSEPALPSETTEFKIGQLVRMVLSPHKGKIGTLTYLHPGTATLPNGLRARAADLRLESGENLTLPLANIEVLE